jgi:K+-sensing histidine kinase KdpD
MPGLRTNPCLEHADEVYAELIDAHRDLTPEQSQALNARLILLLLNHIGEAEVVREAIRMASARADATPPAATGQGA